MATRRSSRTKVATVKFASSIDTQEHSESRFVKQEVKFEQLGTIKGEIADIQVPRITFRHKRKREAKSEDDSDDRKATVGRKYAPPEAYAHLSYLTDYLAEDLDGTYNTNFSRLRIVHSVQHLHMVLVIFCGIKYVVYQNHSCVLVLTVLISPGTLSAKLGCHFAHPTNHFWRCIHQAGIVFVIFHV